MLDLIANFFISQNFLLPFISTVMASATILVLQHAKEDKLERKQKLYAVSYALNSAYKVLFSSLLLNTNTIQPHITATQKILQGNVELLNIMFELDDFDILKAPAFTFDSIPDVYKVLLGHDEIELVSVFDILKYNFSSDDLRIELNDYVAKYLKNSNTFLSFPLPRQKEILLGYRGILERILHGNTRSIWFVLFTVLPMYKTYSNSRQFFFFKKSGINRTLQRIVMTLARYPQSVPAQDYMSGVEFGGIQGSL